jgi:hypothetical protein
MLPPVFDVTHFYGTCAVNVEGHNDIMFMTCGIF